MWVGLIQSVEGLKGKDRNSPRKRGFCLQSAFVLKTEASALPWISSLLCRFQTCHPPTIVCANSLKEINLFLFLSQHPLSPPPALSLSLHTHTHTHTHTLLILFPLENPNTTTIKFKHTWPFYNLVLARVFIAGGGGFALRPDITEDKPAGKTNRRHGRKYSAH